MPAAAKWKEAKRATENSLGEGKKQALTLKKSQEKEEKPLRCHEP